MPDTDNVPMPAKWDAAHEEAREKRAYEKAVRIIEEDGETLDDDFPDAIDRMTCKLLNEEDKAIDNAKAKAEGASHA